jgi:replicative superfamily II helicase
MLAGMMPGNAADIHAADAFAISMLCVIALAMGTIALLFLCMRREAAKRDPQVDALLEEVERDERRQTRAKTAGAAREPWERSPDWWKDGAD